jgi:hypothetical protein
MRKLVFLAVIFTLMTNGAPWSQVGINTNTPKSALNIVQKNKSTPGKGFRLEDGTEAAGKVLTSDADGVGSWQTVGINLISGFIDTTNGISIEWLNQDSASTNFRNTKTYIDLPPGAWQVNVRMLLRPYYTSGNQNGSNVPFLASDWMWVRTTFIDDLTPPLKTISPDIVGSKYISGKITGPLVNGGSGDCYDMMQGFVIINNNSGAIKRYHYVTAYSTCDPDRGKSGVLYSNVYLYRFGSSHWAEDIIYALPCNL